MPRGGHLLAVNTADQLHFVTKLPMIEPMLIGFGIMLVHSGTMLVHFAMKQVEIVTKHLNFGTKQVEIVPGLLNTGAKLIESVIKLLNLVTGNVNFVPAHPRIAT